MTTVNLGANNTIDLPVGNNVTLPTGGSLSLRAQTINIGSSITIPSGTIDLTAAYTINSLTENTNYFSNNGVTVGRSGLITVGPGATLSTVGLWTNDQGATQDGSIATNGGTITLDSYLGDIDLAQDTIINVSAGGYESASGAITVGNGGALTLAAGLVPSGLGVDPGFPLLPAVSDGVVNFDGSQPGTLETGQFLGYGAAYGSNVGKGGTFNLSTSTVTEIVSPDQLADGVLLSQSPFASNPNSKDDAGNSFSPLTVSTSLFSSGGFSSIGLTAAGITLPANVTLAPQVSSLVIPTLPGASASTLAAIATPTLLASGVRPPSSISLHSTGDLWNRGGLVTHSGSANGTTYQTQVDLASYGLDIAGTIETDPLGSVSLAGDQIAVVSGTVEAPGGTINFSGGTFTYPGSANPIIDLKGEGLWLTDTGKLLARGEAVTSVQSNGQPYDDVLPGGSVSVTGGYVILAPNSLIDVSGTSGLATLNAAGSSTSQSRSGGSLIPPTTVDSAGGTVSITSIIGGILEGTLSGQSGGGTASGGTLTITQEGHGIESNGDPLPGGPWPVVESTYTILEPTINSIYYLSDAQIGTPGTDLTAFPLIDANTPLSVQMIQNGGFDSLSFGASGTTGAGTGFLTFLGNPSLSLPDQILINTLIVVPDGSNDSLTANYINWTNPTPLVPTAGTDSSLTFNAQNMDLVGNITVLGASTVTFNINDDLRLSGVDGDGAGLLFSDGLLDFHAGQIYPSTDTDYTVASATEIDFSANGTPPTAPLVAGAELNIYAPIIQQDGTIRSPNGIITLGSSTPVTINDNPNPEIIIGATTSLTLGAGSLTSVSDDGQTVPYGFTQNGDWYYDANGSPTPTQITAPPAKQIILNGVNISDDKGAVIDASGGGDFFAGAFVPGTGGSTNIFAQPNVYAVIPGYSGIAPYDPSLSTGQPSLGQRVYLNGVPGLAAGYYTLLPGQYAELPGAYLVSVQTAPSAKSVTSTQTPIASTKQNDGSYLVSGYFTTPGTRDDLRALVRL